jgi:hypothetical protein
MANGFDVIIGSSRKRLNIDHDRTIPPLRSIGFIDFTATTSDSVPVLRFDTCTHAETFCLGCAQQRPVQR